MKKDHIKEIIRDFQTRILPPVHKRILSLPFNTGKIITITGVRRSGKTYLMYDLIKKLVKNGIKIENIIYINFEDERLNLQTSEFDFIIQGYRELYPETDLKNIYIFFDEVQNIPDWEKFVRRVYDTISQNIYITGSNAQLLSIEIATSLRGRSINYEIFPLSFYEYLQFSGIDTDIFSGSNKARIVNAFSSFLLNGGFPETVEYKKEIRDKTLQEYFNVMIYRDLVERYAVTNIPVLKFFIKRVFESITTPISVNKVYNELKSMGYKIGKNQLYEFIHYAESVYLLLQLKKYTQSVLKQELAEKKYYCIDNGLLNAVTFRFSGDLGKLLENLVFLELRKAGNDVSFAKDTKECDFLIIKKESPESLIQVSYNLNDPKTKKREIDGLVSLCTRLNKKEGIILTMDEEETILEDAIKIEVVPVYKYLLIELQE